MQAQLIYGAAKNCPLLLAAADYLTVWSNKVRLFHHTNCYMFLLLLLFSSRVSKDLCNSVWNTTCILVLLLLVHLKEAQLPLTA